MNGTVLLVDDEEHVLRTFEACLRQERFAVRTATNGEAALDQISGADVILLDMHMPLVDGLTLLRRLRRGNSAARVAVVTGDYLIDDGVLGELQRLGARVVFKPLWTDELVELVHELMTDVATV